MIGISQFKFTEANFAIVASAADVLPRVERLIAGEDVAGLGDRTLPLEGGELEHDLTLRTLWHLYTYVVSEPAGTQVAVELQGENDGSFALVDVFNKTPLLVDETLTGVESGSATIASAVPHFLVIAQATDEAGSFHISSNRAMVPYPDVDDGREIGVGDTVPGNLDSPLDHDYFVIDLAEGETIDVTADSPYFDAFIGVTFPGATDAQVLGNDDGGGGGFSGPTRRSPTSLHTTVHTSLSCRTCSKRSLAHTS